MVIHRDRKWLNKQLLAAWTRKTSSASTGLKDPTPPERNGFAVALARVLATRNPTTACRPTRVEVRPTMLVIKPTDRFRSTPAFFGALARFFKLRRIVLESWM